jgi:hypothetical protein
MQMTVAELREIIESLPDDMPVGYQRIEDEYFEPKRWTTETVVWEAWPGREVEYTEWIGAFSAFVTTNLKGEKMLMVHAHY